MAEQKRSSWKRWLLGQKHQNLPPRTAWQSEHLAHARSDRRRFYSRLTCAIILTVIVATLNSQQPATALELLVFSIALAWAIWFFLFVVILIPFRTSPSFAPNGQRLALDALLSGLNWIIVCGFFYALIGIYPTERLHSVYDYFYFSTVTFSTLGYGDFSPEPGARAIASIQAIVGNLHLGVLVAAAFLVAGSISRHSPDDEARNRSEKN
ncbi:MAG: potassium channel family protein [Pseudomonadota bacterium]